MQIDALLQFFVHFANLKKWQLDTSPASWWQSTSNNRKSLNWSRTFSYTYAFVNQIESRSVSYKAAQRKHNQAQRQRSGKNSMKFQQGHSTLPTSVSFLRLLSLYYVCAHGHAKPHLTTIALKLTEPDCTVYATKQQQKILPFLNNNVIKILQTAQRSLQRCKWIIWASCICVHLVVVVFQFKRNSKVNNKRKWRIEICINKPFFENKGGSDTILYPQ